MRSDKAKNRAKVIAEIIKDPFATQREISETTGLGKTTIQEHMEDLPKTTKSDQIEKIIAKDLAIVELATEILQRRLQLADEGENKMSTRDVIASADVSAKRYTIFKGDVTDKDGGLKQQIVTFSLPDNTR